MFSVNDQSGWEGGQKLAFTTYAQAGFGWVPQTLLRRYHAVQCNAMQ